MMRAGWLAAVVLATGCSNGDPIQWGSQVDVPPERVEDRWESARIAGEVGAFGVGQDGVTMPEAFGDAMLWERGQQLHANVIAEGATGFVMGVLDIANVDLFDLEVGDTLLGGSGESDFGPIHVEGDVHLQGCGTDTYGDWDQEDLGSEFVTVTVRANNGDLLTLGFDAVLEETGQVVQGDLTLRAW